MGKLSEKAIKATRVGRYCDGDNLWLVVKSGRDQSLRRSWEFVFTSAGSRRYMGLGPYPETTLAAAREAAFEARKAVSNGIDPIAERKKTQVKLEAKPIPTFGDIAQRVITAEKDKGMSPKAIMQLERYLGPSYVSKWLNRPVNEIKSTDVLKLLTPIRKTKPEAARKCYPAIKKVFAHARIRLRDEHDLEFANPAQWDDLRAMGYAAPDRLTRGSEPSLPYALMPEFMQVLRSDDHLAARMLEFTVLTNVRTSSTRFAKAEDVDWENGIWIIPPADLKDRKTRGAQDLRIPLSPRALEIINARRCERGLLFANNRGGVWSDNYMLATLKRLNGQPPRWMDPKQGRAIVVHGFRATFQTWAQQTQNFPVDVIREAMGRVVGNLVDRSYSRQDLLEQRRPLMLNWEQLCYPTNSSQMP